MSRPPLEVADIFRLHGEHYRNQHKSLATVQYRAMRSIERCRTAALGGHVSECDRCGHRVISYNSCRNRNCPKCQSSSAKKWLDKRAEEVLPVPYFHVVFTVPQQIAKIGLGNQKAVYRILFQSVSETLLQIAADKRHLAGEIGFLAVLHTWGQNLEYHPHIHCVVPGVVLKADGKCKRTRERFFLAVAVLSKLFKGKFLARFNHAFRAGKLKLTGGLAHITSEAAFRAYLQPVTSINWVVYCKPPFAGPESILSYLGRYTHRIAISNHRLVSLTHGVVRFRWRDYRDGGKSKILALDAQEFIRRFLMHVVPSRFVRIRNYGFLANRKRAVSLAVVRNQLSIIPDSGEKQTLIKLQQFEPSDICPNCKKGKMNLVEVFSNDLQWDTS